MSQKSTLERVRGEFLEMPGLRLTLDQAQRLCGVERALCQSILEELVKSRFLCVRAGGLYVRMTDGDFDRSRWMQADRRARSLTPEAIHAES